MGTRVRILYTCIGSRCTVGCHLGNDWLVVFCFVHFLCIQVPCSMDGFEERLSVDSNVTMVPTNQSPHLVRNAQGQYKREGTRHVVRGDSTRSIITNLVLTTISPSRCSFFTIPIIFTPESIWRRYYAPKGTRYHSRRHPCGVGHLHVEPYTRRHPFSGNYIPSSRRPHAHTSVDYQHCQSQ